jgi:hypothetical protein
MRGSCLVHGELRILYGRLEDRPIQPEYFDLGDPVSCVGRARISAEGAGLPYLGRAFG